MAKQKGFFWEGLASGMRGLYGYNQNERMAEQAQLARSKERTEDNDARMAQIKAAIGDKPKPDLLNNDFDSTETARRNAQKDLADHEGNIIYQTQNPSGWAADKARLQRRVRDLGAKASGLSNAVANRNNVYGAAPATSSKKSEFLKAMGEALKRK